MTIEARLKWVLDSLGPRLSEKGAIWLRNSSDELRSGADVNRFCVLFSSASRHARPTPIEFTEAELAAAGQLVPGWNPERWTLQMLLRSALILSLPELDQASAAKVIEEAFRFADEGEACALYASLCLLPGGERFVERAAEGCRTNMLSVFEADVCDTPFPVTHFDELAWNQALIKCIFIGSPLWRVFGLDARLGPELARMALDLVEERRSAGRPIQPDLWLCLGTDGGDRGLAALLVEVEQGEPAGRAAAGYALARANHAEQLKARVAAEADARVQAHLKRAFSGACDQSLFGELADALHGDD